jgi:hypothetical protein
MQGDHPGGLAVRGTEAIGEPHDGAAVRAAEAVDGLIGIADHDQLAAVAGQRMQEFFLSRVGVLVFVHEDDVIGAPLPVPHGGRVSRLSDPDDLGVVVGGHRGEVEPGGIPVKEAPRGLPVVAAVFPAEPGQAGPVQAALGRAEQEVAQLGSETPGAERRTEPLRPAGAAVRCLPSEQPADLEQLLRAGQQRGRLVACQHEFPAHQGVSVAVEGEGQRIPGGPAEPQGDSLSQLLRSLAAEGQYEDPARIDSAARDPAGHGLHDGGGLPRARTRQHEQRAASMADYPELILIE